MTSPRRVLVSDSVDKSTASHMALILIDRCGMIQKPAKLRPLGPAREIARFTPERGIGNPSVYRKSAASSFETTIERKFV